MAKTIKASVDKVSKHIADTLEKLEEETEMENKVEMENKEETEMENKSAIVTFERSNEVMKENGYSLESIEESENGALLVTANTEDGNLLVEIHAQEHEKRAVKAIAELANFDKLSGLYKAYYMRDCASLAKDAGYKSVGAFLEKQFSGLKANSCNQYVAVANKFLVYGAEYPLLKYNWLKGVSVTNMEAILALFNRLQDAERSIGTYDSEEILESATAHTFYNNYIKTGKLHLLRPLTELRKEINAILGKPEKKKGKEEDEKKKGKENENNTESDILSDEVQEREEVTIARTIAILEKYGQHDLAEKINGIMIAIFAEQEKSAE